MGIVIPGYRINQTPYYSGMQTIFFSGTNAENKAVLIKLLKREHPSPQDIAQFKHEYEAAKLFENTENILQVYEFHKHENAYAIIMEYVNLPTLAKILEKENKIKFDDFFTLAIRIAEAVGLIHQHNIIHKDLNPYNILSDFDKKEIKIIDFGLSADLPKERVEIVSPNVLQGTLAYISPEQTGRMNRGIDYRADYYSLGVIFYQMLSGKLPFTTTDPAELVHSHIAIVPNPPHEIDPAIPEMASEIVMKLLSKKAEDRYQNINGLILDLKECQHQLKTKGTIDIFPIGKKDVFSRFQIPEKLYGRENELNSLLKTYEKVARGGVELMLIAGYSGIGKSVLVHELYKPIVKQNGYFISGKFDQFKHNIPYTAFTQAFEEFIKQLLTEPEEKIARIRKKILDAVGVNGKIIVEVIPDLVFLIGEQPPVAELGPTESLNRFSYLFQNFIKALADADRPLVIFLDDLQWADLSSLKMLETLLSNNDCAYLLILGAYRNNEVAPTHALMMTIEELKKNNIVPYAIDLGPLDIQHVNELISDTLHCDQSASLPLANACYEKTAGNPFFLIQLLQTLHQEQLIEFDAEENRWRWDLGKIQSEGIADNVVDLMVSKISNLMPSAQKALQFAACIGNQFELNLLSKISSSTPEALLLDLQEPLKEGYILCRGNAYCAVEYQFAHDRIQQAAYSLLDENHRKQIHIDLARLLLKITKEDKLDEVIFHIVNHYNIGMDPAIPDYIDPAEKRKIAELNLRSADVAQVAAAFESAFKYAENGLKCVDEASWESDYDLIFNLYVKAAETAYLNSNYDLTEKYSAIALKHAKTILDELKITQILVLSNVSQMKARNAIDLALAMLERLDIKFPKKPKVIHILKMVFTIKWLLFRKKIPDLINLPNMTDPVKQAIVRLISSIISSAYQAGPELFPLFVCTNVLLSLRHGNTVGSAHAYTFYGVLLCGKLIEINNGYEFGELALKLIDKLPDEEARAKVVFGNYAFIRHWKNPIMDSVLKARDNYQSGLDLGDIEYACYSMLVSCVYSFFAGLPLKELNSQMQLHKKNMEKMGQINNYTYLSIAQQAVSNLIKEKENPYILIGEDFDESKMTPKFVSINDQAALCYVYLHKLILAVLFEKYTEASEFARQFDLYADGMISSFFIPLANFYGSLSEISLYASSTKEKKRQIINKIKSNQKMMTTWAKFSPSNYLHKQLIVAAEFAWKIEDDVEKAAKLFDQAIQLSHENKFLNEEALANELAAKCYLAQGKEKLASVYMNDASYCYLIWGADSKLAYLDAKYPQLLARTATAGATHMSTLSTLSFGASLSATQSWATSQFLDIETLQKTSLAISSTILLSDLLKRLMQITMENAGAQNSYLLLKKEGQYFIEAEGNIKQKDFKVLQSIKLAPEILPISIIRYVERTGKYVVLDDAARSEQFSRDPYVEKSVPKSILCLPLLNQGEMTGILYLENNLTEGAFTIDRVNILNMLTSQIAMSIDNARLYNSAKELNEQLIVLNKAFERFVPHDFIDLLEKKSIVEVELGDQVQKNMTILFADIRDFTHRSETMRPKENFDFINSILKVLSPIIRKHNGIIDKYIGDAIMALYPRCADDAIQCALEIQRTLLEYNTQRSEQNPVKIGIGINTGLLMLGTVGEENRMNATVISDAVNIASRVEALTKTYDADILITENVYRKIINPSQFSIKMLDEKVLVKGKEKKLAIYRVCI